MKLGLSLSLALQQRLHSPIVSPIMGLSPLELELLLDQSLQQVSKFHEQNPDWREEDPHETRGNYYYHSSFIENCKAVRGKIPAEKYLEIPQIFVEKKDEGNGTGKYSVMYNSQIEERIAEKLAQFRRTDEDIATISVNTIFSKHFAKERAWVVAQQLAITQYLCETQDTYLQTRNRADLKPITQQTIAEKIGYSDSSVSRLVKNLSIQLPDARIIFAQELITGRGVGLYKGIEYLKQLQQDLSLYENGQWKVSDHQLVPILKERFGLAIARRTVSKYKSRM